MRRTSRARACAQRRTAARTPTAWTRSPHRSGAYLIGGPASIVGAFAAGLILSESRFRPGDDPEELRSDQLPAPLEAIFAPVFFVLIGMQVDLATLLDLQVVGLALALPVAAIFGKLIAGLGAGASVDRFTVGLGMVPRGEVG